MNKWDKRTNLGTCVCCNVFCFFFVSFSDVLITYESTSIVSESVSGIILCLF